MSKIFRSTKSSQLSAAPVNGLSQEDTSPGLRERDPQPRELAHRSNDGLEVTLFWRAGRDEVTVCGSDRRSGVSFKIRPERPLGARRLLPPVLLRAHDAPQRGRA